MAGALTAQRRRRRRRLPHPDRDGHLADARRADRGGAERSPAGALDPVRAARRGSVARRARAALRPARRAAAQARATPTSSCRSTRDFMDSGPGELRYARDVRRSPPSRGRRHHDEPAVHGGEPHAATPAPRPIIVSPCARPTSTPWRAPSPRALGVAGVTAGALPPHGAPAGSPPSRPTSRRAGRQGARRGRRAPAGGRPGAGARR